MYESCFLTACYKILSVEMILHGKLNEGKNVELKKQITRLSVLRLKSYLKLEIHIKYTEKTVTNQVQELKVGLGAIHL